MPNVRIITNAPSDGARELTACLRELGHTVVLGRDRSDKVYTRPGVPTVKWGTFALQSRFPAGTTFINGAANQNVLNKLLCFGVLQTAGVPVPDFTADQAVAQRWLTEGGRVYERHTLSGSGGDGIRVVKADSPTNNLTRAPLYTKGMLGKRREYRIHVFNVGGVQQIFVQQKKRRQGYTDNSAYSNDVRNLDGGWVFAHNEIQPPRTVTVDAAVAAITALGLNFGGVDLIEMDAVAGGSVVLEVNSAPGLQGATAGFYAQSIQAVLEEI